MEGFTRIRNAMLALALAVGAAGCAGNGAQEPYEAPGNGMERPPPMDNPAGTPGSLETQ